MNKEITPEVIEKAIDWLDREHFCCFALSNAIDGCDYQNTSWESDRIAREFIEPLLERDNISAGGDWCYIGSETVYPIPRRDWLRKIAQELREGKI